MNVCQYARTENVALVLSEASAREQILDSQTAWRDVDRRSAHDW